MSLSAVRKALREYADPKHAAVGQRFFKTGPGEYGEGDVFLGLRVPQTRLVAKQFRDLSQAAIEKLLHSKFHEERFLALCVLVSQFERGKDNATRKSIYDYYLSNTAFINNWDLVDCSAHKIVGPYLETRSRAQLTKLAKSKSLWERRIAIISTFHFIRQNDFHTTLDIALLLLDDKEDLIHKAVGWMLREAGNRDQESLEAFLMDHYPEMPRTMLRYAIEKLPEKTRKAYLKGTR